MQIKQILNNSVVLAADGNAEFILIGKGLGYRTKIGDEIQSDQVQETFISTGQNWINNFETLMQNIDSAYFELAAKIIDLASNTLRVTFDNYLLISLTDHIHYAVERQSQGLIIRDEILWETKQVYPNEYELGQKALDLIEHRFHVRLTDDEAGFIAMKLVENSSDGSSSELFLKKTNMVNDILNIVKYQLHLGLGEDSMSYQRLLTHLRFFIDRLFKNLDYSALEDADDQIIFDRIRKKYLAAYACVEKIVVYIENTTQHQVTINEQLYLTIHIQRIINEAQKQ